MRPIELPASTVVLTCSACPTGTYAPLTSDAHVWTCADCGNDVDVADIVTHLDEGETLVVVFVAVGEARLATTTRPDHCATCGTANGWHFSVRLGDAMPATFVPCPDQS